MCCALRIINYKWQFLWLKYSDVWATIKNVPNVVISKIYSAAPAIPTRNNKFEICNKSRVNPVKWPTTIFKQTNKSSPFSFPHILQFVQF